MTPLDFLFLIPGPAGLSAALTLVILVILLYMARDPFHRAVLALGRVFHRGFRLAAASTGLAQERLAERNREVLLAQGREAAAQAVEREFQRVQDAVDRDLKAYPELHRQLSEQIQKIDEEFRETADAPPTPPAWIEAVEAVANMKGAASPQVAAVLSDIHKSLLKAQKEATAEYRRAAAERHRQLARMSPGWRRIEASLDRIGQDVKGLLERSKRIDGQMEEFSETTDGTERAVRTLFASSAKHFAIATLAVALAIAGATVNYHLIAGPMEGMVGEGAAMGPLGVAGMAALVIVFIELAMGLFLMESLRVTRLFPVIGALDDRKRVWIASGTFGLLLVVAAAESMLGVMQQVLVPVEEAGAATVPLVVHTALSFILPFVLAFVAIPLESLLSSGRIVGGTAVVGALRLVRMLLRLLGTVSQGSMRMLTRIYDLVIFLPLWVERMVFQWLKTRAGRAAPASGSGKASGKAASQASGGKG